MRWVKQALGYRRSGIDEKTAGKGVCAAILDTGIARHPDLDGRIADFKDFTGRKSACYDDSGHGTHVAGILAGNGKLSAGMYSGMAPAATLLAAKVLDRSGNGNVESVLRGIEWLKGVRKEHPLRIVNISVGTQPELRVEQKARLLAAVEELWDEGLVVVVSAGNYGPGEGTVAVPGSSPKVITVGVPDTPAGPAAGGRMRRKINYSGRGPTADCVVKPDLFAARDRDHQLQCRVRCGGRTAVYHEDRDLYGHAGHIRGDRLPALQISGYDECGSEAEAPGRMREGAGNGIGLGHAGHGASDAGVKPRTKSCQEKILDSTFPFVYDSKGDCDEQDFRAGFII